MRAEVLSFSRTYGLLETGDRVVCAVSGGADSMALLWCLHLLQESMGLQLSAAHFHHGLRGPEADRDEAFVRAFCARHDIPLSVGRGQVRRQGRGLEDAARQARYDFLLSVDPAAKVATAHTADDNAETVLLRWVRGTSLRGLGGIPPCRGRIIRPMLSVTRAQVLSFLDQWNLDYVEDGTNGQDDFLRNRLRHRIIPALAGENPHLIQSVSTGALRLRQDENLLQSLAEQALEQVRAPEGLDCQALLAQHPALRSRVLERFLRDAGVREPQAAHIAQAEALVRSSRPGAWARFPGGVVLARRYGRLVCPPAGEPFVQTRLQVPGLTLIPQLGMEARCRFPGEDEKIENNAFTFTVGCDTMKELVIWLRPRRPGDQIRLPGGHKSLKKLLIDRKVPALWRDRIPVVADEAGVLAVFGVGVNLDRRAEPGSRALEIALCLEHTGSEVACHAPRY